MVVTVDAYEGFWFKHMLLFGVGDLGREELLRFRVPAFEF